MHNRHRFLLAGVMGWPIAHSRSPKIHNHWLAQNGIEGAYVPLAVEPGKLEAALRALAPLGFSGCNLTIPHKEAALPFMDRVDPMAARIGAINCVVVEADGALAGKNYDGFGFIASLRAGAPQWRAEAAPAVVIGAGGGARAVVAGLLDAGAPEILVFNRTTERAQALAGDFGARVSAERPYVIRRESVRRIFDDLLAPRIDRTNLNTAFGPDGFLPTGENLVRAIWTIVEGSLDEDVALIRVRVVETRKNSFSYTGGRHSASRTEID